MKFLLGMQVASRDANSHIPNERGLEDHVSFIMLSLVSFDTGAADD